MVEFMIGLSVLLVWSRYIHGCVFDCVVCLRVWIEDFPVISMYVFMIVLLFLRVWNRPPRTRSVQVHVCARSRLCFVQVHVCRFHVPCKFMLVFNRSVTKESSAANLVIV